VSGENLDHTVIGTGNDATLTNAGTAYALPPGGDYEFLSHNFYGASNLSRVYGVNGVGPAFEYDSVAQSLTPIDTGMAVDTPNHLAAHRGSLFLSFPGGSIQFSQVGEPLTFNPVVGAGEIGVGSDVTALISANTTTLGILARDSVSILQGNDSSDYLLSVLTDEAGAKPNSARKLGDVIYPRQCRSAFAVGDRQLWRLHSRLHVPARRAFARGLCQGRG
jgi:hypothetical protein